MALIQNTGVESAGSQAAPGGKTTPAGSGASNSSSGREHGGSSGALNAKQALESAVSAIQTHYSSSGREHGGSSGSFADNSNTDGGRKINIQGTGSDIYIRDPDNPAGGPVDPDRRARESSGTTTPPPGGTTPAAASSPASSAPSIDTKADPYAAENAAAAATTQRITQGVDMSEKINEANNAWQQATQNYGEQSGGVLNQLQNATNENIGQYQGNAQGIIDQLSNLTGQQLADYAAQTGQTIDQATTQINNILGQMQQNMQPVEAGRVGRVDTTEQQNILQQMTDNQRQQANQQVDYAVNQGVNELQRAMEDAAPQFQAQRNQIAGQERTARDNSALYSEMRGDRGGIGKAQYDAIANTAATNQLKVNQEQTKLSTDTARQIADLRARGEFDKADKMLEISQEYLGKLMQLKQWADEANISIDEFNIGVDQWEQEYNAKLQQTLGELGINAAQYEAGLNLDRQQYLTGQGLNAANTQASQRLGLESDVNKQRQDLNNALAQYGLSNAQYMTNQDINRLTDILSAYQQNAQNMASTELAAANVTGAMSDNTLTLANREAQQDRLAQAGMQMISSGITPTDAQLRALGWSRDQYKGYKSAMDAAAAAASRRGGGSGSAFLKEVQNMIKGGAPVSKINQFIENYNSSGTVSSSQYEKAKSLTGNLKVGQNYYETEAPGQS